MKEEERKQLKTWNICCSRDARILVVFVLYACRAISNLNITRIGVVVAVAAVVVLPE